MSDINNFDDPIELEIDGVLDLHTFKPGEIGSLIPEYIIECYKSNIYELRIIHGKGKGVLRRSVHSILEKNPLVQSYHLADETAGSWGATIVTLKKAS